VLALLLVGGSGYYFFVVQAQAAVAAPAAITSMPTGLSSTVSTPATVLVVLEGHRQG
jgi:hypothetical protein